MRLTIFLTLVGAGLGVLCALFAIVLGGAGHGWTAAWPYGGLALVLFPLAFFHLSKGRKSPPMVSMFMLVVAGMLDLSLYALTQDQGFSYFERAGPAAWVWILLWAVWQIAFAAALWIAWKQAAPSASRPPPS